MKRFAALLLIVSMLVGLSMAVSSLRTPALVADGNAPSPGDEEWD